MKNLASVVVGAVARAGANLKMRENIILRLGKNFRLVGDNHRQLTNKKNNN